MDVPNIYRACIELLAMKKELDESIVEQLHSVRFMRSHSRVSIPFAGACDIPSRLCYYRDTGRIDHDNYASMYQLAIHKDILRASVYKKHYDMALELCESFEEVYNHDLNYAFDVNYPLFSGQAVKFRTPEYDVYLDNGYIQIANKLLYKIEMNEIYNEKFLNEIGTLLARLVPVLRSNVIRLSNLNLKINSVLNYYTLIK